MLHRPAVATYVARHRRSRVLRLSRTLAQWVLDATNNFSRRDIPLPKLDLTSLAHWSGTGLVEVV